jgi:hypothetical protein
MSTTRARCCGPSNPSGITLIHQNPSFFSFDD